MTVTESDLQEQIAKGAEAAGLRKNPMIAGFIDNMRMTVYENIRTSKPGAIEEREELAKMLRVIDAFERQFKLAMDGGKVARSRLEQLRQKIGWR